MAEMGDDAFVKIISKLGLDYSQALTATRLLAKETQVLDNQLRQVRMTAAQMAQMPGMNNMAGLSTASQMAQNKTIVDQYGRSLSVISNNTDALTKNTAKATTAAKQHANTVKAMAQQYNVLGSQLERRMSWFVTGAAMFGAMQGGVEMVRTMKDVEFGMTEIARVTEDANFNFEYMRDELQKLGIEYGATWDTIHDISLRWAQAGYNQAETIELTRTSLLALNTAELDANYATSGLVAIMAQWGLTADQLMPKMDKLNKVADDYAVTTQDLVDGLNRSSGAARAMGMTFEDTVAILTVMREASGRTGKEVGNALNSIIAFMQRSKSLKVFDELGINVFADEARTKFRPVIDILNDISKSYATASKATQNMFVDAAEDAGLYTEEIAEAAGATEEWTDVQKRDVSQAAAGIYRRSYLLALLNNFTKVYDVLQTQEESLGYTMQENERTMDTLQKQWDSLRAAAEQLAVAIGDAGLLDALTGLVEGTRDAVVWFNELPPVMQEVIVKAAGAVAIITLLNGSLKMLGVGSMAQALVSLTNLAARIGLVNASALSAAGALRILATNPFTLLIGAVGAAVIAIKSYNNYMDEYLDKLPGRTQRAIQEHVGVMNAATAQKERIEQLRSEYMSLSKELEDANEKTAESAQKTSRLKQLTQEIINILPNAASGFDDTGKAVSDFGTIVRVTANEVQRLNDLIREEARLAAEEAKLALPGLKDQLGSLESERLIGTSISTLGRGEVTKQMLDARREGTLEIDKKINEIKRAINEAEQAIARADIVSKPGATSTPGGVTDDGTGGGGGGGGTSQTQAQKTLNDLISQYIKQTEYLADIQGRLNDKTQRSINIKQAAIDFYRREGATVAETAKAYQLEADLMEELAQKQKGIEVEAKALRASKEMLAQRMSSLNRSTEEGTDAFEKLADEIEQLSDRENQLSTEWWTLEGQIKSLNPLLKQMEQNYQNVSDAIGHWARMGVLSAQEQIDALRELSTIKALSAAEQWSLDEQLHGHYMDLIDEEYNELERLYSDRIEQIEKDAETAIGVIQDQIDALDQQQKTDDRAEAERKHNEKLADLQEQYNYHDLRTGAEHEKAKADIAKQIEEEQLEWERQQEEWATDDKKQELEQQIEDVKEAAEEEKEAWQEAWGEIEDAFSDHNRAIIAAAAAAADEWYQAWKASIDKVKLDLESGTPSGASGGAGGIGGVVGDAEGSLPVGGGSGGVGASVSYKIYPGQFVNDSGTAYMKSRDLASYLDKSVDWDQVAQEVILGGNRYKPWKNDNGTTWLPVRDVADDFGWNVGWDAGNSIIELSKAHTGAKTLTGGIAELLPGEWIFPPNLSLKLERLISVLDRVPTQQIGTSTTMIDRGRSTTLNGPLFNAERVVFEDRTDMEIMGRELKRAIDIA